MNGPKTIPGQSQNYSGTTGGGVVPLSRISLDTGLRDCAEPPIAEPIRILLSKAASDHLTKAGAACFIVAGRQSHPDDPSRWILHLVPTSIKAADDAVKVAKGERKARHYKKP
jgi:hypothetical protein